MPDDIEMVRIGRRRWMSREEAESYGYVRRKSEAKPTPREPFIAPGGLTRLATIILSIWIMVQMAPWLKAVTDAVVSVPLAALGLR